ncbi:MAG: hypothetical protein IPK95_11625 [Cellvibrionales bacterium]|nr:hypothetical protein [Cellvibrionales bacterium]
MAFSCLNWLSGWITNVEAAAGYASNPNNTVNMEQRILTIISLSGSYFDLPSSISMRNITRAVKQASIRSPYQ